MSNMYERIVDLCNGAGIKPGKLCAETGLSRGMLTDLKMGRTKELSAKNSRIIADYFGVSVDYLLTGEQKEKAPTPEGERELPFANYRDVLQEGGIRLLLDADAKVSKADLDDIVEFIKFKQRKNGR